MLSRRVLAAAAAGVRKSTGFQSLLHQGVVRTSTALITTSSSTRFQSLLQQGVVRPQLMWRINLFKIVSIPSSSGRRSNSPARYLGVLFGGFNPFFIRASFEPVMQDTSLKLLAFQSLLHQGVVRTVQEAELERKSAGFNPFFIRASFEHLPSVLVDQDKHCFNPFFIRASFEPCGPAQGVLLGRVSIPSSSGRRSNTISHPIGH